MQYVRTERFKNAYRKLPQGIKQKAKQAFLKFKDDPWHRALRVKLIRGLPKGKRIYEGRIDAANRFTFEIREDGYYFRNIGSHAILKRP